MSTKVTIIPQKAAPLIAAHAGQPTVHQDAPALVAAHAGVAADDHHTMPITDSEVAAANKDGIAATPSLRTLGVGAQQAAPGDHTHTLIATSEWAVGYHTTTSTVWELVDTKEVASSKKIVMVCAALGMVSVSFIRILVNEVQKILDSEGTPGEMKWVQGSCSGGTVTCEVKIQNPGAGGGYKSMYSVGI
ncbi:hypothetical protein ES708_06796 [subsurface metagenome]